MSSNRTRRVSARPAAIQESATLAVDAKAEVLKAAGRPVIGFGTGEPNFPASELIAGTAIEAVRDPRNHKYTPTRGLPELRETIAVKTLRDFSNAVGSNDIIVTNRGRQTVSQASAVLIGNDDEVLPPAPYRTAYPGAVCSANGIPIEVFAGADAEYRMSVKQLKAARTDRTKALFPCSLSNLTESVYSPEEVRAIEQWAFGSEVWVIPDEIYEHLVYDGTPMSYILSEVPEFADRAVVLSGIAKAYTMTDWRVGWTYGPSDVTKIAMNFQPHTTSNVANVLQWTTLATFAGPQDVVAQMHETFDRRRRKMIGIFGAVGGFTVPESKDVFYVYPNVEAVFSRDISGESAATLAELAALILEEAEVAAVPGRAFSPNGFLRFFYTLPDEDLIEGLRQMQKLLD